MEIAIHSKPDIIITDWQMPELNGIDIIRELKKNDVTKEIPVVMATGVKMASSDLQLALETGAFDFIRKPLDEIELIARINSALRFVAYHKEKSEREQLLAKIQEEKSQAEIESKKRELHSKTMILIQINQLHEKFSDKLKSLNSEKCKPDCKISTHVNTHAKEMIAYANQQIWNELELHFEQINEEFFKKITGQYPSLTTNERKLCAYLRLNLSTKNISSITSQSVRSIEIARTRLREKLGLKGTDEDLNNFLLNF